MAFWTRLANNWRGKLGGGGHSAEAAETTPRLAADEG